jgi:hydroxymethylbilane synthase
VQTHHVAGLLRAAVPGLEVDVEVIHTHGDKVLDAPLAQIGGKGLFTKELEVALLDGHIDLAVHSLKDLPTDLPDGLALGAVPPRVNPHDAFVCAKWRGLEELPARARVGTSSLRRAAQVLAKRPDLEIVPLRGNVETRLRRVEEGTVDATVLACAGLERLDLAHVIAAQLDVDIMLPAPAQGALGIEVRAEDEVTRGLVRRISDSVSEAETTAERACLAALEGGCQVPVGALARVLGRMITLVACVCSLDGKTVLRTTCTGPFDNPAAIGRQAAEKLLQQGAAEIVAAIR